MSHCVHSPCSAEKRFEDVSGRRFANIILCQGKVLFGQHFAHIPQEDQQAILSCGDVVEVIE